MLSLWKSLLSILLVTIAFASAVPSAFASAVTTAFASAVPSAFASAVPSANDPVNIISAAWSNPNCNTTCTKAFDMVNGSVTIDTSPLTGFMNPRLSAINSTAWEQWYFDSTSSDGLSNLVITFFRDPTSRTGLGSEWVMIDNVFSNGTRTSTITYVAESIISVCPRQTLGLWRDNSTFSTFFFQVDNDSTRAVIRVDTPDTKGSWRIESLSPARIPDGTLQKDLTASSSLEISPYQWWTEAIPGGTVSSNISIKNTPFSFTGNGGVNYFAGSYIWNYICTNWYWVRQSIGPYTIVYYEFGSYIDGKTHVSAFLTKDGEKIFSATARKEDVTGASTTSYAHLSLLHGGKVASAYSPDDTSFGLDFVDPKENKTWHFEFNHQHIGFATGPELTYLHFTRFVDQSWGGEVGGTNYTGAGNSEQMVIVDNFPLPT